MKGYTSQSPALGVEEEKPLQGPAVIQSTCHCVGAHPGYCCAALVVLPSAPSGCRGMRRTPSLLGFRCAVGGMRGPGYQRRWLWPFALPPKTQPPLPRPPSVGGTLSGNIPIVLFLFLLSSYSPFSFGPLFDCGPMGSGAGCWELRAGRLSGLPSRRLGDGLGGVVGPGAAAAAPELKLQRGARLARRRGDERRRREEERRRREEEARGGEERRRREEETRGGEERRRGGEERRRREAGVEPHCRTSLHHGVDEDAS
ncbi:hypothetical protein EYF80_052203 [Liparis tanakae]|uniref:Uncharacterized protein n=1 Tax=Liparis tanakae TaxID=230148 RepID=A0A4Z2F9I8_9TELE|nr:hypothetical protein EYF80_052203 [Liparis tanakae]